MACQHPCGHALHNYFPTSPSRPRHGHQPTQPPSLLTAARGNTHIFSHSLAAEPRTPLSTTSLSSPFSYPASPGGALTGTSPMASRNASPFNTTYNPQQWEPLSVGPLNNVRLLGGNRRQGAQVPRPAPHHVGPDGTVLLPLSKSLPDTKLTYLIQSLFHPHLHHTLLDEMR